MAKKRKLARGKCRIVRTSAGRRKICNRGGKIRFAKLGKVKRKRVRRRKR